MDRPVPIRKTMQRREIPGGRGGRGGVRFVTFSCEKRLALLGSQAIRGVFEDALVRARHRFGFELFAWVVMPEHVHLLVRPSGGLPLDRILTWLKSSVMRRVLPRWKQLDAPVLTRLTRPDGTHRFWQKGGGFDRNVRDESEFMREVRYIHHNPVTRGLVKTPEGWRSSSVRWWMGHREGELACDPPPGDPGAWAGWRGYV